MSISWNDLVATLLSARNLAGRLGKRVNIIDQLKTVEINNIMEGTKTSEIEKLHIEPFYTSASRVKGAFTRGKKDVPKFKDVQLYAVDIDDDIRKYYESQGQSLDDDARCIVALVRVIPKPKEEPKTEKKS